MVNYPIVKITLYVLSVAIILALAVGAAWGFWVIFIAWGLDRELNRLLIGGTSVFWFCIGGLLWLVPSRHRKS